VELSSLQGRKIAIDASMAIYQFLIAVRSSSNGPGGGAMSVLTNAEGETTSHIQGMFNRTIRFLTEGIRPIYVFDGVPPDLKSSHELQKRRDRRLQAATALQSATAADNVEEQNKLQKRLVRAGHQENDDCQTLLKLMGVPIVVAPCEAEAQAAALCNEGVVYAVGTEDMDALTFRTPVLLRKMTFANASKAMIQTMNYAKAIEGLELTHDQFVDLCILLGCDYCDTIRGVGPKTALKLIREHGSIETILSHLDTNKYTVPPSWLPEGERSTTASELAKKAPPTSDSDNDDQSDSPVGDDAETPMAENNPNDAEAIDEEKEGSGEPFVPAYVKARQLFLFHDVQKAADLDLKFQPCQRAELTAFLVDKMGFNPDRVASNIDKLEHAYQQTVKSKPQSRMDSFFKIQPKSDKYLNPAKRKAEEEKGSKGKTTKKTKSTAGAGGSQRRGGR
jgi:flap endonuclease-1